MRRLRRRLLSCCIKFAIHDPAVERIKTFNVCVDQETECRANRATEADPTEPDLAAQRGGPLNIGRHYVLTAEQDCWR